MLVHCLSYHHRAPVATKAILRCLGMGRDDAQQLVEAIPSVDLEKKQVRGNAGSTGL